ncbi:hypothetical protein C8Q80DRAFT_1271101 [Daedaleopsis nitida]|nr:hypothetical protein C8Q80DRAFT_1271101 [Daedaleopsis nitida]
MNVLVLGGSKNIGYYAAVRLLKKGATVTFLLRSISVFDNDEQIQSYVKQGKAQLVLGDGLKADSVKSAWQASVAIGEGTVDLVLSSIGGAPSFSFSKGITLDNPDVCTRSLLNLLSTMPDALRAPERQPRFVVITSMGITAEAHARLPFGLRTFYGTALSGPHVDKLGAERILAHCTGRAWAPADVVQKSVLSDGWEATPGLPGPAELKHVLIVRPALLTDGECRADKAEAAGKGKAAYRAAATEMSDGYRVSRRDVAHFVVEDAVPNWSKWEGTGGVVLAY